MGEVFVARQLTLDRLVAIKLLKVVPGGDAEARLTRFKREAELMARLNHPHVLTAFDFGLTEDDRPYLVMEYIEGGDLRKLMKPGVPMAIDRARGILAKVNDALFALHAQGILHRDLKPENVLLLSENHPKVADFGIAVSSVVGPGLTGTNVGIGTAGYASPEQQYGLPVDERSDQYSLSALAYEMLTGHAALGVLTLASQLNPALRPAVDKVLLRGLDEDPDNRYPTLRAFSEALEASLATRRPHAALPWLLVLGTLVLAAGALAYWSTRPNGTPPREPSVLTAATTVATTMAPAPAPAPAPAWHHDPAADLIRAAIDARAFRIWKEHGQPDGTEADDWFESVDQLLGQGPLAHLLRDSLEKGAYFLWQRAGKPENQSLQHFRQARREMFDQDYLSQVLHEAIAKRAFALSRTRPELPNGAELNWRDARREILQGQEYLPRELDTSIGLTMILVPRGPDSESTRAIGLTTPDSCYVSALEVPVWAFRQFVDDMGYVTDAERSAAVAAGAGTGQDATSLSGTWRNPGTASELTDSCPVVQVSWNDCMAFCAWLSRREKVEYRLGTDAEWQFANRAGGPSEKELGEDAGRIATVAWFVENAEGAPHPVGTKLASGLGLFDMRGNVAEWCLDGCLPGEPGKRAIRGGGWASQRETVCHAERQCRPATDHLPTVGFRLFRALTDLLSPSEAPPSDEGR
jgi:hypothetical protein